MSTDNGNGQGTQPVLPSPARERWQPVRGGLLNMYRYDYEEFRYESGHLLLRGNNGTGKSRVLALQLPFLLDGEIAPHRVEPDGDPAKRIEWNLLMGRYKDRVGYSWLEFGRRDESGDEHYFTVGCGLSAVEGRGAPERWFFVTRQRIGRDLFLQAPAGHAVSRERLRELVEGSGEVITTVRRYRVAVDEALFKLGEQRYCALVDLLIQLRQPQLSRQLEEKKLSDALSQALPPLPDSVVAEIAESFRSLEADREELERYRKAEQNVRAFLEEYSRYVRIGARRRADGVRRTHSAYEATQREMKVNEQARHAAANAFDDAVREAARLKREEAAAAATEKTLQDSPEMKSVHELERAREAAVEHQTLAKRASDELAEAEDKLTVAKSRYTDARLAADASLRDLEEAVSSAAQNADAADMLRDHDEALAGTAALQSTSTESQAKAHISAAVTRRHTALTHVRKIDGDAATKHQMLETARSEQAQLKSQLEDAIEAERSAVSNVKAQEVDIVVKYRAWLGSIDALAPFLEPSASADQVEAELAVWCEPGTGETPVTVAIRTIERGALNELVSQLTIVGTKRAEKGELLAELYASRDRLATGTHTPPPALTTRDMNTREGRPGAPLWKVCDFRTDISDSDRAGLEAALEAAGLLDAWVMPDGSVLKEGTLDAVLTVEDGSHAPGRNLGAFLTPAVDRSAVEASAIEDAVIERVLGCIGSQVGVGSIWVDPSGRFRLGPLRGEWTKPAADHIGEGARESARKRHLMLLEEKIAIEEGELKRLEDELERLNGRIAQAKNEALRAPSDAPLRDSIAARIAAVRHTAGIRERVTAAERLVTVAREAHEEALAELLRSARDLGIERWIGKLTELERAMSRYEISLARLWPVSSAHRVAAARKLEAQQDAERAVDAVTKRTLVSQDAATSWAAVIAKRNALEQSLGATEKQILARIDRVQLELDTLRREKSETEKWQNAFEIARTKAETKGEALDVQLGERTEDRNKAIAHLARFATAGLLPMVIEESMDGDPSTWSVSRCVDVARRVEAELTSVTSTDAAWDRTQAGIHRHIQALTDGLMGQGYAPDVTQDDDIMVVRVLFDGRLLGMHDLRDALASEVRNRDLLLDAREREIIENHLIGEAAAHLHDLLHRAEDFKRDANEELARRPTSTGMMLRFDWIPVEDGPSGFATIRARLLRAAGTWSPVDREAVATFLQNQIRASRARDDTAPWQEHLAVALDYRSWHRFVVERQQDGRWLRLTRRTHGTGSGGEKAIALTIPQFAAAAAHYSSADPLAPRLILLDEAFVGVDSDMRKKCVGLLHAFDLDFVMTSEREWCCYETLPGVAIYQLATRPGVGGIGVTRFVWNGRERVRDDTPLPSPAPAEASGVS